MQARPSTTCKYFSSVFFKSFANFLKYNRLMNEFSFFAKRSQIKYSTLCVLTIILAVEYLRIVEIYPAR